MKTLSVMNRKGGTGKSITTANVGAVLSGQGKKVLLIDADPQGSLTTMLAGSTEDATLAEVLTGEMEITDAIQSTQYGDLITADTLLGGVEQDLKGKRLLKFKEALDTIEHKYDVAIIDLAPAFSNLALAALLASDTVIIPAMASVLSLEGFKDLTDFVQVARTTGNPDLKIAGVLLTMYDNRNRMSRSVREVAEEMAEKAGTKVFQTPIRRTVKVEESIANRQPVVAYSPRCTAAKDYKALVTEIFNG